MKKEFIFIGPPGSGKGTQTIMLAKDMNLPHIDTGSLLREEIAKNLFLEGYACSQAIVLAFKDVVDIDEEALKKISLPIVFNEFGVLCASLTFALVNL